MDLRLPRPGFWMGALLVGIVLLCQIALSIPLGMIDVVWEQVRHRPAPGLAQDPLVISVVNLLACGAAIGFGLHLNKIRVGQAFPLGRIAAGPVTGVVLIGVGMFFLLSEADNLVRAVLPPPTWLAEWMDRAFFPKGRPVSQFLLLVMVAPVTEELLFRGIILRGLLSRFRPVNAIVLTSLLFAVLHLNPWQMLTAFCLGVVIGWFYLGTGSIWVCVLAHALNNGIAMLFSLLPVQVPGIALKPEAGINAFQPWWLDVSAAVLTGTGALIFYRATKASRWRPSPKPPVLVDLHCTDAGTPITARDPQV